MQFFIFHYSHYLTMMGRFAGQDAVVQGRVRMLVTIGILGFGLLLASLIMGYSERLDISSPTLRTFTDISFLGGLGMIIFSFLAFSFLYTISCVEK